jgi:hypothetical protein
LPATALAACFTCHATDGGLLLLPATALAARFTYHATDGGLLLLPATALAARFIPLGVGRTTGLLS